MQKGAYTGERVYRSARKQERSVCRCVRVQKSVYVRKRINENVDARHG